MNEYVAGGYGATLVILGAYALHILRRGRRLSRALPEEERTWR